MGNGVSKIVAGIDIGTSFSGYAYAFKNDRNTIYTSSQTFGDNNDRVPSVVLLDSKGDVDSFGHEAEQKFTEHLRNKTDGNFRLFSRFKMELYSESNIPDTEINDERGKPIKAVKLFETIIRYFKKIVVDAMKSGKVGKTESIEEYTLWIITVPAIWSDAARQIMKDAALAAGIIEEKLRLVLEPEAAALFHQHQTPYFDNGSCRKLPVGSKYIIADLGGGTVDICVHEKLDKNKVIELYRATGGDYGGMSVNNEFKHFCILIFGSEIWDKFKSDYYDDFLQFWKEFEDTKRRFCDKRHLNIFKIPNSLYNLLPSERSMSLDSAVSRTRYSKFVTVERQTLVCENELMKQFFLPSISHGILPLLKIVLDECKDVETIILVGGYSQSQYITTVLESAMPEIKIVHTKDPSLAIVKGAVLMGFESKNVIIRKSRHTYGIALAVPFRKHNHPPDKLKFTRNGKSYCDQVFQKIVEKDEQVIFGQTFRQIETNDDKCESDRFRIAMFRSNARNPKYCIDDGCIQVGEIVVDKPDGGWPKSVGFRIILIAGETEFKLKVADKATGNVYRAYIEFK